MTVMTVFGIKNCATMKRCFAYLHNKRCAYDFVDYKKTAPDAHLLGEFITIFGQEKLINKKSTTYKKLSPADKNRLATGDTPTAIALLGAYPSMIKRPIVLGEGIALLGFDEQVYDQYFAH